VKIAAVATAMVGAAAAISLFSLPWTVQFLVRDIPALTAATVTQPSTVVGLEGVALATIRPVETVIPLPEGELPPLLVDAVLAMEDNRFYRHRGVDPVGLVRAMRVAPPSPSNW
jgi:penicillin-binding protein 1A